MLSEVKLLTPKLTAENAKNIENAGNADLQKLKYKTYKNVIGVSFGFLCLFTAFYALQNLQSSLHSDPRLGWTSLAVINACLLISCMFLPPLLISKLGAKYTIMLSMTGYVLFTAADFYPKWWTLILGAILLGTCGAPLWSAKCSLITTNGILYGEATNQNKNHVITNFFGIFFLIVQTGQIWGNLISSLILKPKGAKLNSTLDVGDMCGANFCPDTEISSSNQETSESTVKTLMSIYLGLCVLSVVVIYITLDQVKIIGKPKSKGVFHLFIATLKHLRHPKMLLLIPITIFSGLEQGFVFGDFTKAYISCAIGIEKVGFVMISFGFVDAFFSFFLGKIVKWWTGRPAMMATSAITNMGLLITLYVWNPRENTMYVFYLAAALAGFSDAVWQTQINAFYGVLFPREQEAAFSNYLLWESLGFVISFAYGDYLCVKTKIIILMVLLVIGTILYGVIEFQRHKEAE